MNGFTTINTIRKAKESEKQENQNQNQNEKVLAL